MGRLTQFNDYLQRDPDDFSIEFVIFNYTHITITPEVKKLRRELKLYQKGDTIMKHIYYTDGACSGSPGPGGWGWVYKNTGQSNSGNQEDTTNNRMEIMGVLMAVRHAITIADKKDEIIIYSDSSYVVNTVNRWLQKWYRERKIHDKKNMDLWREIWNYKLRYNITAVWVRGHFGDRYNEMADRLATTAKQQLL